MSRFRITVNGRFGNGECIRLKCIRIKRRLYVACVLDNKLIFPVIGGRYSGFFVYSVVGGKRHSDAVGTHACLIIVVFPYFCKRNDNINRRVCVYPGRLDGSETDRKRAAQCKQHKQ